MRGQKARQVKMEHLLQGNPSATGRLGSLLPTSAVCGGMAQGLGPDTGTTSHLVMAVLMSPARIIGGASF